MNKTQLFCKELEKRVEKTIKENIDTLRFSSELRYKVEEACEDFVKNNNILKRVPKAYSSRDIFAFLLGKYLFKYIEGESTSIRIRKLTQVVTNMYLYGERPMCCPDVYIGINCKRGWEAIL